MTGLLQTEDFKYIQNMHATISELDRNVN